MVFVSGLLGGFGHCSAMCGPVVAVYSLTLKKKRYIPHLLYNLGRITTYSLLGGVMGLTGSFIGAVQSVERFQNITLAAVGVAMLIMGLALGGWLPVVSRFKNGKQLSDGVAGVIRFISSIKTTGAFFPMGMVLGFLPCGMVYTAFIGAAGVGVEAGNGIEGFLHGMLFLFLFGLGTSPALFVLGSAVSAKGEWLREKLHKGSAIIMIVTGMIFIYRSFSH